MLNIEFTRLSDLAIKPLAARSTSILFLKSILEHLRNLPSFTTSVKRLRLQAEPLLLFEKKSERQRRIHEGRIIGIVEAVLWNNRNFNEQRDSLK
tara:strand:- start:177 stop:461 length:285 start_codon:yes stop_codon:yes gene_type:complete